MDTTPLEALEQDLDAVSRRLAAERTWNPTAWRVRWLLHEPLWSLLWTVGLIAGSFWLGLRNGHSWMTGVALVLLVLPRRIERLAARRAELSAAGDGDLFALYRASLDRRFGSLAFGVFLDLSIALGFLLFALILPAPQAALLVAACFGVRAAVRGLLLIPRTLRESRALGPVRGTAAADSDDSDDSAADDDGSLACFVLTALGYALAVFIWFGAPLMVLVAVGLALAVDDSGGPWALAAALSVAWLAVFFWRSRQHADGDADGDDE